MDDWDQLKWRRRRALWTYLGCGVAFLFVVIRWADNVKVIAYAVGAFMVLGTLAFGLCVVALRCPRCGENLDPGIGRWGPRSFSHTLARLLRPLRCPSCGLTE